MVLGKAFLGERLFCATVGQMCRRHDEDMIKKYLAHHFESRQDDGLEVEPN